MQYMTSCQNDSPIINSQNIQVGMTIVYSLCWRTQVQTQNQHSIYSFTKRFALIFSNKKKQCLPTKRVSNPLYWFVYWSNILMRCYTLYVHPDTIQTIEKTGGNFVRINVKASSMFSVARSQNRTFSVSRVAHFQSRMYRGCWMARVQRTRTRIPQVVVRRNKIAAYRSPPSRLSPSESGTKLQSIEKRWKFATQDQSV